MTVLTPDELGRIVLSAVRDETGVDHAELDTTFMQLDVESLAFAEILMSIEDAVGGEIALEGSFTPEGAATIRDFIKAVEAQLALVTGAS